MAFLSAETLRSLIRSDALICPVPADRWAHIEGSVYDLTVDRVFRHWLFDPPSELGKKRRLIQAAKELDSHGMNYQSFGWYRLWPWFTYLVQSVEVISVPTGKVGIVFPRTSIFRAGHILSGSIITPGYSGVITVGLRIGTLRGFKLERRAKFASVIFGEFDSDETDDYKGVWGGNRLTTDGKTERGS